MTTDAAPASSPPAAPTTPVTMHRLDNGLRVVTVALPHLHSASLSAYVRVGSRFESAADNGLTHFLEHMLFRGTRRLPDAFQINRAVEELGGTLYAETRRDVSLYQISVHPEVLRPGVGLLGEILSEPVFSQIDVERRIVLEEIQEDLDHLGEEVNLSDIMYEAVWQGHPLGQKITGPMRNVERFGEGDLWRHFRDHYGAGNIVLCIAGAVRPEDAIAWAGESLGGLLPGRQHEVVAPVVAQERPLLVHRDGDRGTQTTLSLALLALSETDPDFPALVALSRILDDGLSTRLYQRIVNDLGLAYYVSAGLDTFADAGLFEIEATAVHASVPRLLGEVLGLMEGLRQTPVEEAELDKVKRRYRWDLLSACDEPGSMAEWWGRTELYYPPLDLPGRLARLEAVTAADVQRVAGRIFRPERLTCGTVGRMGSRIRGQVERLIGGLK